MESGIGGLVTPVAEAGASVGALEKIGIAEPGVVAERGLDDDGGSVAHGLYRLFAATAARTSSRETLTTRFPDNLSVAR